MWLSVDFFVIIRIQWGNFKIGDKKCNRFGSTRCDGWYATVMKINYFFNEMKIGLSFIFKKMISDIKRSISVCKIILTISTNIKYISKKKLDVSFRIKYWKSISGRLRNRFEIQRFYSCPLGYVILLRQLSL